MERQIRVLEDEFGNYPFQQWLRGLPDVVARARIDARVTRLRAGNPGQFRNLGDGVYEMKIDYGPGYRVYYTEASSVIVVLIGGGSKKTQQDDLDHAKALWRRCKDDPERLRRIIR